MRHEKTTDEELMLAYAGGDGLAFRQLFARLAPGIQRVAHRRTGSAQDAADVVQQTFLQVHWSRHDFRPRSKVRPWVFTIAFNLIRDLGRRERRRKALPLGEEVEAIGPSADESAWRAEARRAVRALPSRQRRVIALRYLESRDYREIAALEGATAGATRVMAHRALARLRAALSG